MAPMAAPSPSPKRTSCVKRADHALREGLVQEGVRRAALNLRARGRAMRKGFEEGRPAELEVGPPVPAARDLPMASGRRPSLVGEARRGRPAPRRGAVPRPAEVGMRSRVRHGPEDP